MSNDTAKTITTNIVPVQGTFEPLPPYECINLIGPAGTPFYAPADPNLDGVSITNSTINSTTIGATTPSTAAFTTATMTNQPVGNLDLCNKTYVDAAIVGISWKQPVRTATTANITLSGNQTIDTVAVTAGDRVLVKDQTDDYENGIYIVGTPWTRSPDANTWDELVSAMVFVESGGQAGAAFYCPIQPGGTLGVTAITWSNFSVAGTYFAGTGLSLAANTFSITNTGVSANTYGSASAVPTIAINAQGQITSATATPIAIAATAITSGTIDSGRLTGTYNIDISGNAATATSATTAGSASTATTATNLAGGASGNVPYQTGAGATSFLATGSDGQVLTLASGVPSWATPSAGTVTSVSGTGTVSGISLSGTVTSSGDLTLGGTLDLSAPPVIGNTTPNSATFTTVNATTFDTNVAAAGVTLAGTTLAADGTDANINILIDPKGTGGVGIGGSPSGVVAGVAITSKFCVKDEGSGVLGGFVHANNTTAASPAIVYACRSRGTLAVPTVVQNNDSLASFIAAGFDGTDLALAARIDVEVDGTPGSNDMPARIVFKTTPDGSQAPIEAMRIGSNQTVTVGTAALTTATVSNDLNLTGTLSLNGSSGTAGYVLTSNGASDPTWEAASAGLTITDDTTTNATRYLTFTDATTGTETGLDVSSTKLQFNPSTGALTSTTLTPTNALGVAYGGTGSATLTANNVLLGNGTSALQVVAPGTAGNVLTSDGTTWTSAAAGGGFPSGTVMLFGQTSAPTGWTKDTSNYNNSGLRVVTGTASTGGSVDFTTAFASQTPTGSVSISSISGSAGATTLGVPTIPSHSHTAAFGNPNAGPAPTAGRYSTSIWNANSGTLNPNPAQVAPEGGGGSHTHPFSFSSGSGTFSGNAINLAVKYVDVIRATKD